VTYAFIVIQFDLLYQSQRARACFLGQFVHAVKIRLWEAKGENVASYVCRKVVTGWIEKASPESSLACADCGDLLHSEFNCGPNCTLVRFTMGRVARLVQQIRAFDNAIKPGLKDYLPIVARLCQKQNGGE
jgi:hypothetical protein